MKLSIRTDGEAYQWIVDNIHQNGKGEFKIFTTSRKLIRLFVSFENVEILGQERDWYYFGDSGVNYLHREAYDQKNARYAKSLVGNTLLEALQQHADNFHGKNHIAWLFEDMLALSPDYRSPKQEYHGSLEEFVTAYNNTQKAQRRNNYYNIDIKKLKR